MLSSVFLTGVTRNATRTACRMMSTFTAGVSPEPVVKTESKGSTRSFILNRPEKLNALDDNMLGLLRGKIETWSKSELCGTIIGRGEGRAFCAGGDVSAVVENAQDPARIPAAVDFFKKEFEVDYMLANLKTPYVTILDGVTMGGGVGLVAHAPFRIATEKTRFGMPETKIGYFPDVGASSFLSRADGQIGTYLALTSDTLVGRAVFEHGFATHYIASRRIPMLLERLAELEEPSLELIDRAIEEHSMEREHGEPPAPFVGAKRVALDYAFRHDTVERIISDLEVLTTTNDGVVQQWASETLGMLHARSPTSLKVALQAIRTGQDMTLGEVLNMELKIATAFCRGASPDFVTGVNAVLVEKKKEIPPWSPGRLEEVTDEVVSRFFDPESPYLAGAPELEVQIERSNAMKFGLPSEDEIESVVRGRHGSGGTMSLSYPELVERFVGLRGGKMGVTEKIAEVVERRCELTDNADGNRVWLRWKTDSDRRSFM